MHADLTDGRRRDLAAEKNEDYEGLTMKIRSKGRMDAERRWWLTELPAAVCEKAWLHPGEEETMHKWYAWWVKMKKEDEKRKMKKCINKG